MLFLALDISKSQTGWASWETETPKPRIGHFKCGNEFSSDGMCQDALWRNLADICAFGLPDVIGIEAPADPSHWKGGRKFEHTKTLIRLSGTAAFFAHNKRISRFSEIEKRFWFPHFIGTNKRPPKGAQKTYCIEQCEHLGIAVENNDQADAVGILDYMVHLEGILPPWRNANVLTRELGR